MGVPAEVPSVRTIDFEKFMDIKWDSDDEFTIIEEKIVSQGRWTTHYRYIVQENSTKKFFEANVSLGSTENQDTDRSDVTLEEVEPYEVTITKYRKKTK